MPINLSHAAPHDGRSDDQRDHLRGMWAAVADSWAEHADYTDNRHSGETEAMLHAAQVSQGQVVLELASGAGGLGIAAAGRVGPRGRVLISDAPNEMVTIAARRAAAARLTNVETTVLELENIDQPDRSFDAVLVRDGLQFVLDPVRALTEIHRVLRPGGHTAVAVWGARQDNPWLGVVLDAVSAQLGKPVPPPGMPGPFALADTAELCRILDLAGFIDIEVTELDVPLVAYDFEEWWHRTSGLAGPLTAVLRTMPTTAAAALQARLLDAVEPYRNHHGLHFPGLALLAAAQRRAD